MVTLRAARIRFFRNIFFFSGAVLFSFCGDVCYFICFFNQQNLSMSHVLESQFFYLKRMACGMSNMVFIVLAAARRGIRKLESVICWFLTINNTVRWTNIAIASHSNGTWTLWRMYFLLKMGILQPAMLVHQRIRGSCNEMCNSLPAAFLASLGPCLLPVFLPPCHVCLRRLVGGCRMIQFSLRFKWYNIHC